MSRIKSSKPWLFKVSVKFSSFPLDITEQIWIHLEKVMQEVKFYKGSFYTEKQVFKKKIVECRFRLKTVFFQLGLGFFSQNSLKIHYPLGVGHIIHLFIYFFTLDCQRELPFRIWYRILPRPAVFSESLWCQACVPVANSLWATRSMQHWRTHF